MRTCLISPKHFSKFVKGSQQEEEVTGKKKAITSSPGGQQRTDVALKQVVLVEAKRFSESECLSIGLIRFSVYCELLL